MASGISFGAIKWPKVGVLTLGATIGYLLSLVINLILVQQIVHKESVAEIITHVIVIIVTMVISFKFYDYAVIMTCCIIGSYVFFRVITTFCLT